MEHLSRRKDFNTKTKASLREYFNSIHGTNHRSISRIRDYYENLDGRDYTVKQVYELIDEEGRAAAFQFAVLQNRLRQQRYETKMEERRQNIVYEEEVEDYPVKISEGLNDRLNARVLDINFRTPFIHANLEIIREKFELIYDEIPSGYVFGLNVRGQRVTIDEDGEEHFGDEISIVKSFLTDDFENAFETISSSKRLEPVSNAYYITTKLQGFHEVNQGGVFKKIEYDDLKAYNIYSPSSKNCGRECLSFYGVDVHKGFLSLTDMKAKSPVPVLTEPADLDEFILLRNEHFVRCVKKSVAKQRTKDKYQIITDDKLKMHADKLEASKVLIYDFECYNKKKNGKNYQTPVFVGFCSTEDDYDYYTGEKCLDEFVEKLEREDWKYLIGFNSGRYDYILLKNSLVKYGFSIQEYRHSSNAILKSIIFKGDKKIEMLDLCNFTTGTLKINLENYGCSYNKLEIDYAKICENMTEDFRRELIEYCKADVVGTYQLYKKLNEPFMRFKLSVLDLFTLSQGAFTIVKRIWKKKGIYQERISRKKDDFFREAIYGGRCEVFKREFTSSQYEDIKKGNVKYDEVNDYMRALDVNSLYPSAMACNKYPVGDAKFTTTYKNDKLGIYKVRATKPKTLKYPILCSKKDNSYNLDDEEGTYTSVDIEQAKKYGYTFKILSGYYWEESEYVFKEYVEEFFEVKRNSEKGSPQYQNAKLMLNAPYGKTIQRDENITHYIIQSDEDMIAMKKGKDLSRFKGEFIDGIGYYEYHGDIGEFTEKKSFVGAFILSYTKVKMSEVLQKVDAYYTDTDSCYVESKDAVHFPISDKLGDFSDDYKGKIICAFFVAKKLKYIEILLPDGSIEKNYTGKGCYTKALSKGDFKKMLKSLHITNIKPFSMKRNLKDGSVEFKNDEEKIIKMNDGHRIFDGNDSQPRGWNKNMV